MSTFFYLNGKHFFPPADSARYAHMGGRESMDLWVFFLWWEGLWDKGCEAMPVEFSLDQSCSQRQHDGKHRWMPASTLEMCTASLDFQHKSLWLGFRGGGGSAVLSAGLRSGEGGWVGGQKHRRLTEIHRGERMERERWNGSVASKKVLHQPLVFFFLLLWICVESGSQLLSRMADNGNPALSLSAPPGSSSHWLPNRFLYFAMTWATGALSDPPEAKYGHGSAGFSW